jgi:hypothetical protein
MLQQIRENRERSAVALSVNQQFSCFFSPSVDNCNTDTTLLQSHDTIKLNFYSTAPIM